MKPVSLRPRLGQTVILLGFISLCTDLGSEMIFPLLPVFLTGTLGAGPAFLGLIEGAADLVASILKLYSGRWADRWGKRKPLVVAGYGLASTVRPLVALATAPWHVLVVRLTDRVGKGLRSSPRDALIADTAAPGQEGRAFGFHQAMDHLGAVGGPLIATGLLGLGLGLREVFWCAAVPGAVALVLTFFIREAPRARVEPPDEAELAHPPPPVPSIAPLPRPLKEYLFILIVFSLGNSSDAFLLLRAHEAGVADAQLPLLWTWLHVIKFGSSYLGGLVADRLPRSSLVMAGWGVYALVYFGMGMLHTPASTWILMGIYGLYYGLSEPAEKAMVKALAPAEQRGQAYGAYNFVLGISKLPAGLLVGGLWGWVGPLPALSVGAVLAGGSAVLLWRWRGRHAAQLQGL